MNKIKFWALALALPCDDVIVLLCAYRLDTALMMTMTLLAQCVSLGRSINYMCFN